MLRERVKSVMTTGSRGVKTLRQRGEKGLKRGEKGLKLYDRGEREREREREREVKLERRVKHQNTGHEQGHRNKTQVWESG